MEFTILNLIEFVKEFAKNIESLNKSLISIEEKTKEKQLKIKKDHDDYLLYVEQRKGHIDSAYSAKTNAFNKYEKEINEINERDKERQEEIYRKMTEAKFSENAPEVEHLRRELFANKEQIKKEREQVWQEYKNECDNILKKFETKQKEKNQDTSSTRDNQSKEFETSLTDIKNLNQKERKTQIDSFKSKFNPDVIEQEYVKIYDTDPLFGDYKNKDQLKYPGSIRIASLFYNLPKLDDFTKIFLETNFPSIYKQQKLILPYCATISKTNGICFLLNKYNRDNIYKTLQEFILKLVLQIQPGLLKLTLYDGEGSAKNLIGLSHIDRRIKGENILTDPSELKKALEAAVSDMNTIIQKVLGSKYADKTLMDYNEKAGDQAINQYHIICITDFPNGLNKEHLDLISKIVRSGRQAGVFVILAKDTEFSPKNSYDQINPTSLYSEMHEIKIDSTDSNLHLNLNNAFPDTDKLEEIQDFINGGIKKISKVEVKLDNRVGEEKLWNSISDNGIETPIGQLNITDLQNFTLSVEDGSANIPHHCLIGGATGSGKTVLLHNIICWTAWNYSPDEVQFILLDYKEGVEFKVYENLPHARVLSIHSEREYGISVLEYLDAELTRRGKLFKDAKNAQNIAKYKENSGEKLPRLLVIIDEFQVLLNGDMKTSMFVSKALDDIGRRGRSFGIHLILSSQSLSGVDISQTLSHLGLRIALKLNTEKDCDLFLGQGNHDPYKVLEKKGEAIYNANGGQKKDNVRFQVAYLSDKDLAAKISALQKKYIEVYKSDTPYPPRFIYDGSVNANFVVPEYTQDHRKCKIYIGEPVALEAEHASYSLLRQNESNVLVVGQDILAAMSILNYSIRQIIPQSTEKCQVYICNKVNMDNDYYGKLDSLPDDFSDNVNLLENDPEIQRVIESVFNIVEKRKEKTSKDRIILAFVDIYNVRALRKSGYTDSPLTQKLVTILKDGPGLGVHCIIHSSSYDNLKNIFDVLSMLNEFNVRLELRGGDGYKIFQSSEVGIEKSSPNNYNIANLQTSQMNSIRKIKIYSF